jgi:hypothetical protein
MSLFDKFVKLLVSNKYVFIFSIFFAILLLYSIIVIFELTEINPFLYFEF